MDKFSPGDKIESLSVPDDDAYGWIKMLYEAGFDQGEIDSIMTHLNDTYARAHPDEAIEQAIIAMENHYREINPEFHGFDKEEMEDLRVQLKREIQKGGAE